MIGSILSRKALSLAVVSLLASSAAADVFESLSSVPKGEFCFDFDQLDVLESDRVQDGDIPASRVATSP